MTRNDACKVPFRHVALCQCNWKQSKTQSYDSKKYASTTFLGCRLIVLSSLFCLATILNFLKDMKHVMKPLLYVAAVLLMSVSCEKKQLTLLEPPYEGFCKDGSCCMPPTITLKFSKKIENARADFDKIGTNYGFVIENIGSVPTCDSCAKKVKDLEPTYFGDGRISHAYRVWGLVFICTSCTSIGPYPPQLFYVEKVEKIK